MLSILFRIFQKKKARCNWDVFFDLWWMVSLIYWLLIWYYNISQNGEVTLVCKILVTKCNNVSKIVQHDLGSFQLWAIYLRELTSTIEVFSKKIVKACIPFIGNTYIWTETFKYRENAWTQIMHSYANTSFCVSCRIYECEEIIHAWK